MIKKLLLPLLLLISTFLYAEAESRLTGSFELGNFYKDVTEFGNVTSTQTTSPGLSLNYYHIWDESPIGLYIHGSVLFPVSQTVKFNDTEVDSDLDDRDFNLQLELIVGPGYIYKVNYMLDLHIAAGVSLLETISYSESDSFFEFNLGIGCDIGFAYELAEALYLDLGCIINYAMKSYEKNMANGNYEEEWLNSSFSMVSLQPYLGVGIIY